MIPRNGKPLAARVRCGGDCHRLRVSLRDSQVFHAIDLGHDLLHWTIEQETIEDASGNGRYSARADTNNPTTDGGAEWARESPLANGDISTVAPYGRFPIGSVVCRKLLTPNRARKATRPANAHSPRVGTAATPEGEPA